MLFAELLHEVTSLLQPSPTSGEASEWSGVFFGSIPHHTSQGSANLAGGIVRNRPPNSYYTK